MTAVIDRVWPEPATDLSDADLLDQLAFPADRTWLRVNFISSLDGAATHSGRSGGLGDDADRRIFDLLRYEADAVLVAAGTLRDEGYGGFRVTPEAVAWRTERDLPEHPVLATVTRSLSLDPASSLFTDAPVRPIVYTVASAPADRRAALETVADVVTVGETDADMQRVREDLAARGLRRIHSEGGPSLFGALLAAGAADALHLTLAPVLESGDARRIAGGQLSAPVGAQLASVLRAGDELLLQYQLGR